MNKNFSQFLVLGGANVLRIPIAILTVALLSRIMGPDGVGKWSMVVAAGTFFHSVFLLWTQSQSIRFAREEWLNKRCLTRTWAARRPLIYIGLGLSVVILAFPLVPLFEPLTGLPSSWWPLPLAYLIGLWCLSESKFLMQITGKFEHLAALSLAIEMLVALYLLIIAALRPVNSVAIVIVGMIALTTICSVIVWAIEYIYVKSWGGQSSRKDTIVLAKLGWPVAVSAFFGFLSDWADHLILQHYFDSTHLGQFHAGYMVMTTMMGLASPLLVIFVPKLVDQLTDDPKAESNYIRRLVPILSVVWLLVMIPSIALLPWLFITVFGSSFRDAIPALLVLCIVIPGAIFSYLYSALFNVQGRAAQATVIIVEMVLLNIAISLLLIPQFGALGAAISSTISYFVYQLLYVLNQHRYLSVSMASPMILFGFATLYGVLQCLAGDLMVIRLVLGASGITAIIILARRMNVLESICISSILPQRLNWAASPMERLLAKR